MRRLRLRHETRYEFSAPVALSTHVLRLRPREGADLRIESSSLTIEPSPAALRWKRDPADNAVAVAEFDAGPTSALRIVSEALVQLYNLEPLDFVVAEEATRHPFAYERDIAAMLAPYLRAAAPAEEAAVALWLSRTIERSGGAESFALLDRCCRAIKADFAYSAREEEGVQTPSETLALGQGSCRDFAALLIAAARGLGIAARFVSGYRYEEGLPRELGATHAWMEAYLPGAGWIGFDPTAGELAGPDHIAAAVVPEADQAPPVSGAYMGPPGAASLFVDVLVERL